MKLCNYSQAVECRPTYRHSLGILFLAIVFLLPLAAPKVVRAQDTDESIITNPVTGLWESVVKGVGTEVGSTTAGWVMSAIGISNSANQEQADLTEIIDLLDQISEELSAIETDFDDLKCETAQDNVALNNAITKIGGLYDRYTDYATNFNAVGTIPSWEGTLGVQTWLNDIFEPESGVQAQLIAIQNALIEPGGTGVISECLVFIVDEYQQSESPTMAVFDWTGDPNAQGIYDKVQALTDFYYLYQSWAAVLLTEAYHVQACLDLENSTPGNDSNCTFVGNDTVTPQAGVTSNTSFNLCASPANNNIAGDCLDAQSALTNLNDNGAYDGLRAQLIAAGAPYSNVLIGKVMTQASLSKADLIYPKSLEDFTDKATANGEIIQKTPCAFPLTSAEPCGFTVGGYNHTAPSGTSYGEVTDESGKVTFEGYDAWKFGNVSNEGDNLTTLLANYIAETAGDTSGTLGSWMASIGFINNSDSSKGPLGNPELKIVLTGEVHNAAGSNEAVCFIDTNIKRSNSGQPWCDDGNGATNTSHLRQTSGGTFDCGSSKDVSCVGQNFVEENFTDSSTAANFYVLKLQENTLTGGGTIQHDYFWTTEPGWFKAQQDNTQFHNFHWPSLELKNLPSDWCTVRNEGSTPDNAKNAGGIHTMCGKDLEAWLNNELPPPTTAPTISQSLNATTFGSGDTLSMGLTINNNLSSSDFYLGGILPDGNTMFFLTGLYPLTLTEGFLDDPTTFHPFTKLADLIPIGQLVHLPALYSYTFFGGEPIGNYQLFTVISKPGAFSDGSIDEGDTQAIDIDIVKYEGIGNQ